MRQLRLSAFCLLITPLLRAQSVPSTINYQGRLTDNTPSQAPVNAVVGMRFEIWDDPAAGSMLWQEPNSAVSPPLPVPVSNGIFNVLLGSHGVPLPASLFSGGTARYLQVTANGEALTPRQAIGATGYANQAENASAADSAVSAAMATLANGALNSDALGGVAAASWQMALIGGLGSNCGTGQFLHGINQDGTHSCATVTSALQPPINFVGSVSFPLFSASNAGSGDPIYGENTSITTNTAGIRGRIPSTTPPFGSAGVRGENLGTNGFGYGVWGSHDGFGPGVYGTAAGSLPGAKGVYGHASATTGSGNGVYGDTNSPAGYGGYFSNNGTGSGTALFSNGMLEVVSNSNNTGNNTARFSATGLVGTKFDSHIHFGTTGDWYIRSALATGKVVIQDTGGQLAIGTTVPVAGNVLTVQGDASFGTVNFGSAVRQMLNLWGAPDGNDTAAYGIGVQGSTQYFRTALGGGYAWYKGGTHSDTQNDPGAGGTALMTLNSSGQLALPFLGAAGATALCRNASNQISTCSSSLRYKTNLKPFSGGLELLNRLKPITFDWKADHMPDVGFGAEDVASVNPLFVTYNAQGQVEGVKYDRLNVLLVNGVRELQDQLKAQQGEIAALKAIVCADHPGASMCAEKP